MTARTNGVPDEVDATNTHDPGEYLVTWVIDVFDADNARAAALDAEGTMRYVTGGRPVFEVQHKASGVVTEVDLEDDTDDEDDTGD